MKRVIYLLLLIILVVNVNASSYRDSFNGTGTLQINGDIPVRTYVAWNFTAGTNYKITNVSVNQSLYWKTIAKTNVSLWSQNSTGDIEDLLATSTNVLSSFAALGSSRFEEYLFDGTYSLSAGTVYWLVMNTVVSDDAYGRLESGTKTGYAINSGSAATFKTNTATNDASIQFRTYGDDADALTILNSTYNITSKYIFGERTPWRTGNNANITANLLSFTLNTSYNSNCSARIGNDTNYTTSVAYNSNYQFATTDTKYHSYTVYDDIDENTCLYIHCWDGTADASSGCLGINYTPLIEINYSLDGESGVPYCDFDMNILINASSYSGNLSCYYSENATGSFVNHSITLLNSSLTTFYGNYSVDSTEVGTWRIICNDSGAGLTATDYDTFSFTPSETSLTLYLNGVSADRNYEFFYGSNLTAIVSAGCSSNLSPYLSLTDLNYGTDFTSGTDNYVYYNYSPDYISISSFISNETQGCYQESANVSNPNDGSCGIDYSGKYVSNEYDYSLCYQETANISTSCGGLSNGSYYTSPAENWTLTGGRWKLYDGDWVSGSCAAAGNIGIFEVNYTTPELALNSSLLEIKTSSTRQNLSVGAYGCFNETKIRLRITSQYDGWEGVNVTISCWNNTDWKNMRIVYEWCIREEAMWWQMDNLITWANFSSAYDSNWNTYAYPINENESAKLWINYTAPENVNSAYWQVKYYNPAITTFNHSIPSDCLGDEIGLLIESYSNTTLGWQNLSCQNLSSGNFTLINTTGVGTSNYSYVFEESVWWTVSSLNSQGEVSDEEVSLVGRSEYVSASVSVEGDATTDIKIAIINSSNVNVIIPGTMNGNTSNQSFFSNKYSSENLTYIVPGTQVRYMNLSANNEDENKGWLFPNLTLEVKGFEIDPEGVAFEDKFDNISWSYLSTENCQGAYWIWDDFSKGEIGSRWNGDYTVVSDSHIWGYSYPSEGAPDCSIDRGHYSDTSSFYSSGLNLQDRYSTKLNVNLVSGYSYKWGCIAVSHSYLYLKDTTSNSYQTLKYVEGGGGFTGTIEIKKNGNYFEIYENGGYTNSLNYVSGHDYEIMWSGNGVIDWKYSCDSVCGASSSGYIYDINISGMAGKGQMQNFSNCNVSYNRIFNSSLNITKAIPTIDIYYEGDDTDNLQYAIFLSVDNGTTWERATNGTPHVFTTKGTNLTARIELNTSAESDDTIILNDFKLDVIPGYISGLSLDIGYDGTADWEFAGLLNGTNSTKNVTVLMDAAENYILDNCVDDMTCLVPLAFTSSTAGTLQYSNVNLTQEFNRVFLGYEELEEYMESRETEDVLINFTSESGDISASNLSINLVGNLDYVVTGNFYGNSMFSSSSDSQIFRWRYSKFAANYTAGTSFYSVYPKSLNAKAVSPYGQQIRNNESASVSIWNITSYALHAFDLYRWYNSAVNSCLTEYSCTDFNQSTCLTIGNFSTTTSYPSPKIINSTYVWKAHNDTNYESETILFTGYANTNDDVYSYINYNTTGLPDGTTVYNGNISLYIRSGTDLPAYFSLYVEPEEINTSNITWANKPSSAKIGLTNFSISNTGTWTHIPLSDVTLSNISSRLNGTNIVLRLESQNSTSSINIGKYMESMEPEDLLIEPNITLYGINGTYYTSSANTPILYSVLNTTDYKLYDFWNLTSCNGSNLYLPGNNTFRAICSDCVKVW